MTTADQLESIVNRAMLMKVPESNEAAQQILEQAELLADAIRSHVVAAYAEDHNQVKDWYSRIWQRNRKYASKYKRRRTYWGYANCGANQRNKIHCPKGHPLSGDNVYSRPGTTWRECKACKKAYRERARRWARELENEHKKEERR